MSHLKDKVVIITGASRNIGFAVAASLVARGAKVALLGRDQGQLDKAAAELGPAAKGFAVDIASHGDVKRCFAAVEVAFGRIDALVNNAGLAVAGRVEELKPEDVVAQVNVNYVAVVYACQLIIPHLRRAGGGRIVNISSASVHHTDEFTFLSIYSSTKAGMERFTEDLRDEVRGDNIGVTYFIPGGTMTGFGSDWAPAVSAAAFADWIERSGPYCNGWLPLQPVAEQIAACMDLPAGMAYDFLELRAFGKVRKLMEEDAKGTAS
jgi:NAD(P)-dependent dehydrogenase (short-subunit alcohol dehydrogenase family)